MTNTLPDFEYVSSILHYDPETGVLTWKRRPLEHFSNTQACGSWNTQYADKEAGSVKREGRSFYRRVSIGGRIHRAHRLAYLLHHGVWPNNDIDHRDGDGLNNRIDNLRDVTNQDNQRNAIMRVCNISGANGVGWDKHHSKWRARITVDGRLFHIGFFDTIEEATAARLAANRQHGFTERHGQKQLDRNVGETDLAKQRTWAR